MWTSSCSTNDLEIAEIKWEHDKMEIIVIWIFLQKLLFLHLSDQQSAWMHAVHPG